VTDLLTVDAARPDQAVIARAAACLRSGGLVAFPTETVYGLGVNALDPEAVRRLFTAKGRPSTDPLIVHVTSIDAITPLVSFVPPDVPLLARRFWPGPLTLVLPRARIVPDEVTARLDTVGIRIPAHPVARALIDAAGVPVAAPSANLFSRPSPTRAAHVVEDLTGRIDVVLDGGDTAVGLESTVLDLSANPPTILRPGAITLEMLREILPSVTQRSGLVQASTESALSPGLLEKHYSPRAPLTLYEGTDAIRRIVEDARVAADAKRRVGVLVAPGDFDLEPSLRRDCVVHEIGPEAEQVARHLYETLRQLDAEGVDLILARTFASDEGLGVAVRDRLRRAAAGRIVRT
jgi:L-threonylcarbamoyladenylate synthase